MKQLWLYDTTTLSDSDTALEFSQWVTMTNTQAGNSSFGEARSVSRTPTAR